jgi:hypothetical protein
MIITELISPTEEPQKMTGILLGPEKKTEISEVSSPCTLFQSNYIMFAFTTSPLSRLKRGGSRRSSSDVAYISHFIPAGNGNAYWGTLSPAAACEISHAEPGWVLRGQEKHFQRNEHFKNRGVNKE